MLDPQNDATPEIDQTLALPTRPETLVLHSGKFLEFKRSPEGWEYVDRVNASGAVIIMALTKDDKVVLVEQFRPPVNANVIGFPAGLIGDHGADANESAASAAERELLEEAGFEAGTITEVFRRPAAAALTSEIATFVLATDLTRVGPGGGVDSESIIVHEVPIDQIDDWLEAQERRGALVGGTIGAGIRYLEKLVEQRYAVGIREGVDTSF